MHLKDIGSCLQHSVTITDGSGIVDVLYFDGEMFSLSCVDKGFTYRALDGTLFHTNNHNITLHPDSGQTGSVHYVATRVVGTSEHLATTPGNCPAGTYRHCFSFVCNCIPSPTPAPTPAPTPYPRVKVWSCDNENGPAYCRSYYSTRHACLEAFWSDCFLTERACKDTYEDKTTGIIDSKCRKLNP
jgi:hypothetical protein